MKALVTGAGGAIGSRLCVRLLERGHSVRGLFLPGESLQGLDDRGVEVVRGDITLPDTLTGIADGINCVFHLAARVTDWGAMNLFRRVIVQGTMNVLEQSTGRVERFVYVSSIAAYGMGRHLKGFTEDAPRIVTGIPYCDCKLEAEDLVRAHTFGTDTSYTIIRPANVMGPGSVWVREVIDKFLTMPVPRLDGGRHSASLVYVDNLADGMVSAAVSDRARNRAYNFRDDYRVTWRKYLADIGAMVGKRTWPSLLSSRTMMGLGLLCEAFCQRLPSVRPPVTRMAVAVTGFDNDVDSSRAREELGWRTLVTYSEALEAVEGWVAENYPDHYRGALA